MPITVQQGPAGTDPWLVTATLPPPPVGSLCSGQVKLAVGGTAVQFPSNTLQAGVVVTAYSGNSGPVTLGGPAVNALIDGTGNGKILEPGESVGIAISNTNGLWLNGPVAGRFVSFIGS